MASLDAPQCLGSGASVPNCSRRAGRLMASADRDRSDQGRVLISPALPTSSLRYAETERLTDALSFENRFPDGRCRNLGPYFA